MGIKKCNLSKEINTCPFCDIENMICNKKDTKCAFQERERVKADIKEEKWFEKYYKGSKPIRSK